MSKDGGIVASVRFRPSPLFLIACVGLLRSFGFFQRDSSKTSEHTLYVAYEAEFSKIERKALISKFQPAEGARTTAWVGDLELIKSCQFFVQELAMKLVLKALATVLHISC